MSPGNKMIVGRVLTSLYSELLLSNQSNSSCPPSGSTTSSLKTNKSKESKCQRSCCVSSTTDISFYLKTRRLKTFVRKTELAYLSYDTFGEDFTIALMIVCARDSKHQIVGLNFSCRMGQLSKRKFLNFSSLHAKRGF